VPFSTANFDATAAQSLAAMLQKHFAQGHLPLCFGPAFKFGRTNNVHLSYSIHPLVSTKQCGTQNTTIVGSQL
jgi:hypothetical protein